VHTGEPAHQHRPSAKHKALPSRAGNDSSGTDPPQRRPRHHRDPYEGEQGPNDRRDAEALLALDYGETALLCLFHDTQETRVGDIPSVGRDYLTTVPNEQVTNDQVAAFPAEVGQAVRELVAKYEARTSAVTANAVLTGQALRFPRHVGIAGEVTSYAQALGRHQIGATPPLLGQARPQVRQAGRLLRALVPRGRPPMGLLAGHRRRP